MKAASMHAIFRHMLVVALLFSAGLGHAFDGRPLIFGVLNQQSATLTAERWNPILRHLTEVTGIPLQLKMGLTVEATNAMMGRGEFDLVFTNHNFQSEFDGTYKVIARWAGKPIHGVLAVADDGSVKQLKDLKDRKIAFPSKEAFVAYAVPVLALKRAGIEFEPVFAGNQDGAMAQLKARQVDAAAVNSRFLEDYAKRESFQYREIFRSEAYHELPVIIHPRVPKPQSDALQQALLGMKNDPRASAMLSQTRNPGFEPASDADYNNVRQVYRASGQ